MGKIILTGDRPTGKLHLGHYVGSLRRRVELQNSGEYDKIYVMIADAQALTDNADNPEKIRQNIIEVALDYLSAGIDPEKTTIFIQSQVPELTELAFYYMNLVTVSLIELTREIVNRFNHVYGPTLVEPEILLPENAVCMRLPGTDGKAKMSKSLGNCIYLSDTSKEVAKKVKSMYTDPLHLNISDPGHLEGNCPFIYLDAFCNDKNFSKYCPDYQSLQEMKDHYTRGGLGDGTVKKTLISVLEETLAPIRERRHEFEKDIPAVFDILKRGSEAAREVAAATLDDVRRAMKINYFEDSALIAEQAAKYK